MANRFQLPFLGYGLGLRSVHYPHIFEHRPAVDWFEIISENFMDTGGRPLRNLARVLEHYPVVMHGVSLSIGTVDPLDSEYLQKLKKLADRVNPPWISDHLCWTGVAHKHSHDLLPVPYTEEALAHIVQRIAQVQDVLGRRILLENPSSYIEYTDSTMPEWEFLARMAEAADCGLLLDVNNIYVACFNQRRDPKDYLDALPYDRIVQVHLSGHTNKGTHIIDTHDDHVIDEVWALYRYLLGKTGNVSTMIEWDDKIPDFPVLEAELQKAREVAARPELPNALPSLAQPREAVARAELPYREQLHLMQQAILSGDNAAAEPARWIVAKPSFPPEVQLDAYINGYRYRLFDIVEEDYPVLRRYIGDEAIEPLIREFVDSVPSTHFNVAKYIRAFPAFYATRLDAPARELADLETELSLLFDHPETTALTQQHMQDVSPERLMQMQLLPRTALTLMRFEHAINAYYTGVRLEENPEAIIPGESFLAVFRHEDRMRRVDLEAAEYRLLQLLFSGLSVEAALEKLLEEPEMDAEMLLPKLSEWFARWIGHGMLAADETLSARHAAA